MEVRTTLWEQLALLRQMTERTGILHDGQIFQMKVWNKLLWPNAKTTISIDTEQKNIIYDVKKKAERIKEDTFKPAIPDAPQTLGEWTQALLGPDWKIEIKVHKSPRAKTIVIDRDFVRKLSYLDQAINAFSNSKLEPENDQNTGRLGSGGGNEPPKRS